MKREELKEIGLTDDQITSIMKIHGQDIQAEQARTAAAQKTADDNAEKLKTYEGIDVAALQKEIQTLQTEKSQYIFNGKIKDAINAAGGRSVKAISALLDLDALEKTTENQDEAITKAVEALKADNAWAFQEAAQPQQETPKMKISTGDEHGTGGSSDDMDGVEKYFREINPGLKF